VAPRGKVRIEILENSFVGSAGSFALKGRRDNGDFFEI
jgi:hypothetical protein